MPDTQDSLEVTLDADRQHLEALREAGIPKALEADAMASIRQARDIAKVMDAIWRPRVIEQPLWCHTCGARYSQECECIAPLRNEIPLPECE